MTESRPPPLYHEMENNASLVDLQDVRVPKNLYFPELPCKILNQSSRKVFIMNRAFPLPKTLVLVRHAEAENNVLSRKDRTRDEGFSTHNCHLTKRGKEQAAALGMWLRKHFTFDRYYSSYYVRALETFRMAYPNIEPIKDARLIELRRGIEDLMTDKEIDKHLPWSEKSRKQREGRFHFKPLNGESWADGEMRLRNFFLTLQIECPGEHVVVFGHGKTLPVWGKIFGNWDGEETVNAYERYPTENASVTVYRAEGKRMVLDISNFAPWKERQKKKKG